MTDGSITQGMTADASSKRDAIMRAAIKVFSKKGYYNSRISDIARGANVAHGLIYHYFPSKEDVLLYIFQTAWSAMLDYLKVNAVSSKDPVGTLQKIITWIFTGYRNNPDLVKIMIMDVPRSEKFYNYDNQRLYNSFFECLEVVIREGQEKRVLTSDIAPSVASHIIHGVIDSIVRQYVYNPQFDARNLAVDEIIEQTKRTLLYGLCITNI